MFPQRVELWSLITPRGTNDVSSNEASKHSNGIGSKYRNGISSTQTEALAKAVANACIRSTTRPKANRLRTTHPDEDGPYGHIFATILGRMRAHDGPGQRSPGPAHPPPGWNAGTSNERNNEQRKCYPFLLVGSNRQTKSPVGLQKGNILPKMGSVSFSMFDSR